MVRDLEGKDADLSMLSRYSSGGIQVQFCVPPDEDAFDNEIHAIP